MNIKPFILVFIFLLSNMYARAQQVFSEGKLVYQVTIDPPANQEGLQQYKGTYTILVKNSQVKKELALENGFMNTILADVSNGVSYSLRKIGNNHYAVQIDEANDDRKKKYVNYSVKEGIEKRKLAGHEGNIVNIIYKDGSTADMYYDKSVKPAGFLFDWFPDIEGLPLAFEKKNEEGMMMHFTLQKIETSPLESHLFKLPPEYKIISSEEYKKLMN